MDAAVSYGPGLRWAFAGPALCYHLGGGKGGAQAMADQFDFDGSEETWQNLLASIDRMTGGRDMDSLEQWRDQNLLAMLKHLKMTGDY